MRRILLAALALVMVVAGTLTPARSAHADDWCWGDPIVLIDGKLVNINVGVQGTSSQVAAHVSYAVTIIYVPLGVSHSVVGYTPAPFAEKAAFVPTSGLTASATEINIRVETTFYRMTSGSRFAGVEIIQGNTTIGQKIGRTDEVITVAAKVRR